MNEKNLLAEWKECKNKNIPFLFIKKYYMQILSIENTAMIKYKNICIYKEDFESFRYIAGIKALNTYTTKVYTHSFVQHYLRIYKSEVRDYCKKLTKQSFQILNYSTSYSHDPYLFNKIKGKDTIADDAETKDLVSRVLNGKNKINKNEKEIIFMKIKGYTNREISESTKINVKSVSPMFNKGINKLKMNYNILNNYKF